MANAELNLWTQEDALGMANGVAHWLDGFKMQTPHGLAWGRASEQRDTVVRNLYAGSAGIAMFYLEHFTATGEVQFLQDAKACGQDLVAL